MDIYRRGTDRSNTPKKILKPPLTQPLCPLHVTQCRTVFLSSSAGSTLKSRRIGGVQTHIRSFSLFCRQICISGPCWRFSSREKDPDVSQLWFFMFQMDTCCGTGTMVLSIELRELVRACSWRARSPILTGSADGICSVHTPSPACTPRYWQDSGSHSSPNPDARGSRREMWACLICYHLTHRYTLPFNE